MTRSSVTKETKPRAANSSVWRSNPFALATVVGVALLGYLGWRSSENRTSTPVQAPVSSASASTDPHIEKLPVVDDPRIVRNTGKRLLLPSATKVPPSLEAVEASKGPPSKRDPAIADEGIRALAKEPKCTPPSVPVRTGFDGDGGVGCELKVGDRVLPVGRWVYVNEAGELREGEYESGLRVGTWRKWHKTGRLIEQGDYVDGQQHGVWRRWNADGEQILERPFTHGHLHGVVKIWRSGGPARVRIWEDGVRIYPAPKPGDPERP